MAAKEAVAFFRSEDVAEKWGAVMNALHAFAQADKCPPGGSVTDWFVSRTGQYHSYFAFSRTVEESLPDDVLERMARAHDTEEAAQKGEPSPWDLPERDLTWEAERIAAMRQAVGAIGGRT